MTTAAIRTEITVVYIISVVAIVALCRLLLLFIQGLEMTAVAMDLFMRTANLEIGCIVIKRPDQPVVRVMALFAILTQSLLVDVIALMTILATGPCILERRRQVAGFTAQNGMLPNQGEITQVMVEMHILQPPAGCVMALIAVFPQLRLMRIFMLMAAIAGLVRFALGRRVLMTGLATGFFVRTFQRKFCLSVVIKAGCPPGFFVVALLTFFTVLTFVHIIQPMTAVTAPGNLLFPFRLVICGMAAMAINPSMAFLQFK